jgi:tRNA A-37 threonylcarbamoyl transferase component Bud32
MKTERKRASLQKTRRIRGGIRIMTNYDPSTAFDFFIKNATFSLFSTRGSNCTIVLAKLNPDIESPYRTVRTNDFNAPVNQLLIKFCSMKIATEVRIQQELFYKTFNGENTFMEPICPGVVYAHTQKLNRQLKTNLREIMGSGFEQIFEYDVYFIAMELMDGYRPLKDFEDDPNYQYYKYMGLYELDKMHKAGYAHGDYHYENILIHPSYNYFEKGSGKAILIDFGRSSVADKGESRFEMLQYEVSGIKQNIFEVFEHFDSKRAIMQDKYVLQIEKQLNAKLKDIIKHFVFYRGGGMENKTPRKTPEYREGEWSGLDADSFFKIVAEKNDKEMQRIDPVGYAKLNKSIQSVLDEQKRDPQYLEKLMKAQFNGFIVER